MSLRAESLLRLYPRAWRERYGEEFLATIGRDPLSFQQVVDIVSGAIDARLSADVRGAAGVRDTTNGGGMMLLKSICARRTSQPSTRDALIGGGVMVGSTAVFAALGVLAKRQGWPVSEAITSLAFPTSLTLSMPFWLMKGQPWKAQAVIIGFTLVVLGLAGWLASLT